MCVSMASTARARHSLMVLPRVKQPGKTGTAQSAARIDHPNVVKVYDVLSHDGKPWLVMQLVHGQTLQQKLRAGQ